MGLNVVGLKRAGYKALGRGGAQEGLPDSVPLGPEAGGRAGAHRDAKSPRRRRATWWSLCAAANAASAASNSSSMTFEKLKQFLTGIPFNGLVGLRLVRLHKDGVSIECPMRPELLNGNGVLHGGVTATLADVAVGMALARHLGRPRVGYHGRDEDQLSAARGAREDYGPVTPGEGRRAPLLRAGGDIGRGEAAGGGGLDHVHDPRPVSDG